MDENQGAATPAPITAASLKTGHPAVYAEVLAAGAQQERERITAINAQAKSMPGHDKLIAQCIADGKSAGETALAIVAAEGAQLEAKAAAHAADAPAAVKSTNAPGDTSDKSAPQNVAAGAVALFTRANGGVHA